MHISLNKIGSVSAIKVTIMKSEYASPVANSVSFTAHTAKITIKN